MFRLSGRRDKEVGAAVVSKVREVDGSDGWGGGSIGGSKDGQILGASEGKASRIS